MQTNYRKMICILALTAAVFSLSATKSFAQWNDRDDDEKTLEGTWVTEVTPVDCQSRLALAPPFLSLATFNKGGTYTETTSSPAFFPAQRSPGHGAWIRTGPRSYKASSMALITLNGILVRTQTITQTIEVKGPDQFVTTAATIEFALPDGTPIPNSGCATAVRTRFDLQR